jgi:hypothetical protein
MSPTIQLEGAGKKLLPAAPRTIDKTRGRSAPLRRRRAQRANGRPARSGDMPLRSSFSCRPTERRMRPRRGRRRPSSTFPCIRKAEAIRPAARRTPRCESAKLVLQRQQYEMTPLAHRNKAERGGQITSMELTYTCGRRPGCAIVGSTARVTLSAPNSFTSSWARSLSARVLSAAPECQSPRCSP